jgi:tetratricopeptide (TPR) repeat protein
MEADQSKKGLSYKIKIPIIILTLITLGAMGALFIKIAFSVNSSEKKSDSYQYLRNVGDKLRDKGLHEQAIDQYIKYLEKTKINTSPRAFIAHTVGELYMELSNCQEALVWLFQAEEVEKTYHRADELKKHIDMCSTKINSLKPSNLNAR